MCALRRLLRHEGLKMGFITGLRVVLVQSFGWRAGMRRRPQVSVKFEITKRTAAQAQGRVNRNGRSDFKNKLPRPLHGRQHKCFLKLHDLYVGRRCMVVCPNRRGAHDSDWRRLAGDKRRTQRPPPPPPGAPETALTQPLVAISRQSICAAGELNTALRRRRSRVGDGRSTSGRFFARKQGPGTLAEKRGSHERQVLDSRVCECVANGLGSSAGFVGERAPQAQS